MTFGPGAWGADAATSRAIFAAYRNAGGNFVDTADIYSGGESEQLVGQFIRNSGTRDDIVLATKFGFNDSASPLAATQAGGGNPNAGGAGAKNIHRALDVSLKRLATDYIDLYWMLATQSPKLMLSRSKSTLSKRVASFPESNCRYSMLR